MARDGPRIEILHRSSAGTGAVDATTKDRRTTIAELEPRTYDPVVRRHVVLRETKA